VAIAIAARDPHARPGAAVAPISGRPPDDVEAAFTPGERTILARWTGPARAEWSARFRCAKEAAVRSAGAGIADDPHAVEVVHANIGGGALQVRPAATGVRPMLVASARRGESVWAWTLGEGVDP
jgi:4'-phosphopantetheinyl transferase superfamily